MFGVQTGQGIRLCSCFSCGYRGDQEDLLIELYAHDKRHGNTDWRDYKTAQKLIDAARDELDLDFAAMDDYEARLNKGKLDLHEFPEHWLASFKPALDVKASREYLAARHVPEAVSEALDIRFDSSQGRICFPVRDFNGVLRGLHGRAMKPKIEPRYRMYKHDDRTNPLIWLGEQWVDFEKPVVIVEGPFDLASVARVYRNIASPLFASVSYDKLQRFSDARTIVSLFDHGKGGDAGRDKLDVSLPTVELIHLRPPEGMKDAGDMNLSQLQELLENIIELDDPIA